MWDSAYTTPELSDIAMALIRHMVVDIRRQNGKVVQHISLPKPTAFPACKENFGKMNISKKHFRPGGMAPSEWTRSVRAVRDTPVADYSAPGINTTRCVAYCPPIAVSPFLLALSVYMKYTLYLSHLLISLALSTISWIHAIAWILAAG